jgi:hypothetical protein
MNGGLTQAFGGASLSSTCADVVDGTRNPHVLRIDHISNHRYSLHGISAPNSSSFCWHYNGYNMNGGALGHVATTSVEPSDNVTLSTTLARTNPSRPHVDVPLLVFELKDIVPMLHDAGKKVLARRSYIIDENNFGKEKLLRIPRGMRDDLPYLPRYIGEKYLEWHFAIKPLLDDMAKLMQFTQAVEKKYSQLRRLQSGGSSGGHAVVWEDAVKGSFITGPATPLYQEANNVRYRIETTRRKWGTCVWIPTVSIPPQTHQETLGQALRLTFGLDVSFATVWNAMPWSWLADWFSNTGDIFDGNRNTIPVRHDGSCVMEQAISRLVDFSKTSGPGTLQGRLNPYPLRAAKLRTVVGSASPIPEFNLPFLNGKQLGILASLVVTKKVPTS